jgi:uncharacterized CHY-type Zn-finger protein
MVKKTISDSIAVRPIHQTKGKWHLVFKENQNVVCGACFSNKETKPLKELDVTDCCPKCMSVFKF